MPLPLTHVFADPDDPGPVTSFSGPHVVREWDGNNDVRRFLVLPDGQRWPLTDTEAVDLLESVNDATSTSDNLVFVIECQQDANHPGKFGLHPLHDPGDPLGNRRWRSPAHPGGPEVRWLAGERVWALVLPEMKGHGTPLETAPWDDPERVRALCDMARDPDAVRTLYMLARPGEREEAMKVVAAQKEWDALVRASKMPSSSLTSRVSKWSRTHRVQPPLTFRTWNVSRRQVGLEGPKQMHGTLPVAIQVLPTVHGSLNQQTRALVQDLADRSRGGVQFLVENGHWYLVRNVELFRRAQAAGWFVV